MNLNEFIKRLEFVGSGNAKRTAEELAAHVIGCKPLEIYFREFTPAQKTEFEKLIARAAGGEPVQYIIGHVDFRGLKIQCDSRALIPRPETELLVESIVQSSEFRVRSDLRIVDVGTGTGCIALSLLNEIPDADVTAVDISLDALALAKKNADALGFGERLKLVQSDLLKCIEAETFDVVVSNPPYIASTVCDKLDSAVRDYEPRLALDGGGDGLDLIRKLAAQAFKILNIGGGIFLEIGFEQGAPAAQCLTDCGFRDVEVRKDYCGHDRIVRGLK